MNFDETIDAMDLLKDRIDASSLDDEMADAADELNRSLDRIAAIVDEHRNRAKEEPS